MMWMRNAKVGREGFDWKIGLAVGIKTREPSSLAAQTSPLAQLIPVWQVFLNSTNNAGVA
jgi:hypothetical protein